jgi:hypothetical protein
MCRVINSNFLTFLIFIKKHTLFLPTCCVCMCVCVCVCVCVLKLFNEVYETSNNIMLLDSTSKQNLLLS